MFKNNFDTKQRFGIRKSTKWKTAGSVLLGTYAILSLNTGLASADEVTQPVATDPAIEVVQPTAETSPATTEAPVSEAPVSEAPVSEAPVSEAPVSEAPVSEAPVSEAPVAQSTVEVNDDLPTVESLVAPLPEELAEVVEPKIKANEAKTIDKTASDIFTVADGLTLTDDQNTVVTDLEEVYDYLPAPIRNAVTSITVDSYDRASHGYTYSLSGQVVMNSKYFDANDDTSFESGVLLHEIGHVIDGLSVVKGTYKDSVDAAMYSFSRDRKVQSLIKAYYPDAVNYEGWASMFAEYMSWQLGTSEPTTDVQLLSKEYFDATLAGLTSPSVVSEELANALATTTKYPIYNGTFVADTVEEAEAYNNAVIRELSTSGIASRSAVNADALVPYEVAIAPEVSDATDAKTSVSNHKDAFVDIPISSDSPVVTQSEGTANYDMVVTNTVVTDGIIPNYGTIAKSTVVVTTTNPATLSENSKLRVTITPDKAYEVFSLQGDSTLSNGIDVVYFKGDSTNGLVAEIPVGALSEGTIKSFTNSIRLWEYSKGIELNVRYELIDNDTVLRTATDTYVANVPNLDFQVYKFTNTEYLTTYAKDGSVASTMPLPISTVVTRNGFANMLQEVEYTVPDGFVITDSAKAAGWMQTGNIVTKKFYWNRPGDATLANSDFLKEFGATTVMPNARNTDVYVSGLEFDTSAYGTVDELTSAEGKSYRIDIKVYTTDENGYNPSWSTTVDGVLRATLPGQGEGIAQLKTNISLGSIASSNGVTSVDDSAYTPSKYAVRDELVMQNEDYKANKKMTIPEMTIVFDDNNLLDNYSVALDNLTAVNLNSTIDKTQVGYNIYSLDDDSLLGKWTADSSNRFMLNLPDNISGIVLRPVGSVTEWGASTLQGVHVLTFVTPLDGNNVWKKFQEASNTPRTTSHLFTVNGTTVEDMIIYTDKTYSVRMDSGDTAILYDKKTNYIQSYTFRVYDDKNAVYPGNILDMTDNNANVVMTIPAELTFTDPSGKTYTNGTFTIPLSELDYTTSAFHDMHSFSGRVKANTDSAEGIYPITFALDWSGSSEYVFDHLEGVNPLALTEESTKATRSYTIRSVNTLTTQSQVANVDGVYSSAKKDVVTGTEFNIRGNIINTLGLTVSGADVMQYLPTEGVLDSTYTVRLTGEPTVPSGWTVYYGTGTPIGDFASDFNSLAWSTSIPTDFTSVVALRYVQDSGTLANNSYLPTTLPVVTTDALEVDDIAYTQMAIKSTSYPNYVISNKVSMEPLSYIERWVRTDTGDNLQNDSETVEEPPTTPDESFPKLKYVRTEIDPNTNTTTHYYDPVTGSVVVRYVDEFGNSIKDQAIDTPEGTIIDTAYNTDEDYKETSIEYEGNTYQFLKRDENSANAIGVVVEGETVVTYVYEKVTQVTEETRGSVIVHYKEVGTGSTISQDVIAADQVLVNTIVKDVATSNPTGTIVSTISSGNMYDSESDKLDTVEFDGFTYNFVYTEGTLSGLIPEGLTVVTHWYEVVPKISSTEDKGSVIVQFVDENGVEIKSQANPVSDVTTMTHTTTTTPDNSTTVDMPNGATYDVTNEKVDSIVFNDFTYEYVRTDGVEAGDLPTGETIVTHVYKVVPKVDVTEETGSVVVRYVDENGRDIASSVMPVFDVVTATHTTTTTPDGSETVYTLSDATYDVSSAKVNEITFENFDYTFVRTEGGESGILPTGETVVTHVYKVVPKVSVTEAKGSVVVEFKDTKGNVIRAEEIVAEDVLVSTTTTTTTPAGSTDETEESGNTYTTVPHKQDSIEFNGFTYNYVRVDGSETGTVAEGETRVTYVYGVTPKISTTEDTGSVVVRFTDENGNEIKPSVTPVSDVVTTTHTTITTPEGSTTADAPSGATYDVTAEKVDRIEFEGSEYVLLRTEGTESGVLPTGETTITHVYHKVITEIPNEAPTHEVPEMTITRWITEEGEELAPVDTGTQEPKEFDGYTFESTEVDGPITTHIYHEVVTEIPNEAPTHSVPELTITRWIDEAGDELTPIEKGTQDPKDFDGYTLEGTEVDGPITTHTYHKVVTEIPNESPTHDVPELTITRWIDEDGAELSPIEEGTQEPKEFDGHTFEHTEVEGPITTHIYHQIVTEVPNEAPTHSVPELTITRYITEDGEELSSAEEGTQEPKEFDGYTFESTEVDGPVTTHVYHKVVTEIPNEAPTHSVPELTITRYITEAGEELSPIEEGVQEPKEFDGYTFEGTEVDGPITTHVYHEVVTEIPNEAPTHSIPELTITRYITEDGEELSSVEEGTQEPKEFDGYTFESTTTDGSITTHVYHKVVTEIPNEAPTHEVPELTITRYITEDGEELTPIEEGTQEPKDFDGYTFERTEVDGPVTTHTYHKVVTEIPNESPTHSVPELQVTRYITEGGEELTTTEEGTREPKEFEGYTFERTEVDGGITTHVYHKVITEVPNEAPTHEVPELQVTRWVTEDGEELTPIEEGTQDPKEFDGYTFERTEVDGGITTHVYHRVVTEVPNEAPTHAVPELEIPSETPEVPGTPAETPVTPEVPAKPETPEAQVEQPQEAVKSAPVAKAETAPLPETGDESNLTLTAMGLMLLGFVGIRKRRKD